VRIFMRYLRGLAAMPSVHYPESYGNGRLNKRKTLRRRGDCE
jgi:hypothetical protein